MGKLLALVLGIIVIIVGYIAFVSLYLPLRDNPQAADAIVVVSGGDTNSRTLQGIKLYEAGWAKKLVFSGAAKDPNSASNARAMLAIAAARGVPQEDVLLEEDSRDTIENARNTWKVLGEQRKIILVTSEYHQRRALKEFQKVYGDTTEFISVAAKDKNWGRKSWFLTPYGWWISVTETVRLLF